MTMDVVQLQRKLREHQAAMFQQVLFFSLLHFDILYVSTRFDCYCYCSTLFFCYLRSNILSQYDVAVGPHVCFIHWRLLDCKVIFRKQNLTPPLFLFFNKTIKVVIFISNKVKTLMIITGIFKL